MNINDIVPSATKITGSSGLFDKVQVIIQALLLFVGATAVLFIVIGGFQFIISGGNPENIQRAKNSIIYSIIGLAIAVLSYVIVTFVIKSLQ